MKELKFKFDLNCKVAVYVPSTTNVSKECDNSKQTLQVIRELSVLFGGATSTPAVGGWVCENGEVVTEHVNIVYSFCTSEQLREHFDAVLQICERIKLEMSQEAVTLEVNGQVKFI